jgi:flagellar hook-associated protein 3 FlgL
MIYTRMTNRLMSDNVINTLLTNRSKLNEIQEQISSGKKVSKPSDDPSGAITILSDNDNLLQIEQYLKNIDSANSELDVASQSISSAVDVVQRAKELTVQAANTTNGSSELSSINDEIKQLIDQIKDLGNTKFGNIYIFGGCVTQDAPFQSPSDGQVQYTGTPSSGNYQRKIEVSNGVTVDLNISGDALFGQYYEDDSTSPPTVVGNGLLNTLTTLSQALSADPPDYNNIRSKTDDLDNDLSTLTDAQAKLGGTQSRLDITKSKLEDDQTTYTKGKSSVEDIDLAKSISDMSFQQSALQASLSVGAQVLQSSLLEYLS